MRLKNPNRWIYNETKRWTSTLKKLRDEKIINDEFEIVVNSLTLEDLIAIKLELSCRTLNSPLYGIPIYKHLREIVKDAVIKFAVSTTQTTSEAAILLGLNQRALFKLTKKYGFWDYFDPVYLKKMKEKMRLNKERRLLNEQNKFKESNTTNATEEPI